MGMNFACKPATQFTKFPDRKSLLERTDRPLGGGENLGGVNVPQRVRREIADQPIRPMDVLKTAGPIIRGRDAEIALIQLVPGPREIRRSQIAIEKRALELEPNQHV